MLSQYYTHTYFRVGIGTFFALGIISYVLWYNAFALHLPQSWIPLFASIVVATSLVLFPTETKRLPILLVPLVLLVTIVTIQAILALLPHNLTPLNTFFPILFIMFVSGALIIRTHTVLAWVIFGIFLLLILKWHLSVFISPFQLSAELIVPAIILGGVHVFKKQIQQASHKARQSRILLQHAKFGREREEGVSNVAAHRVQEVRLLTEEMLHRIAYNDDPVTAEEIKEFGYTEAQLRDTIRGRHIVNPDILEASLAARRRGARVDILDERGESFPDHINEILTECAVDMLEDAHSGTITIRAFPADDPIAVMLVHDVDSDSDEPAALEIAQDTGEIIRF